MENNIINFIIIAILLASFLFQNYKYEGAKDWVIDLRKENKDLRGAIQRKAANAAEMLDDILIMEKAIQAAQKESERLKDQHFSCNFPNKDDRLLGGAHMWVLCPRRMRDKEAQGDMW